ncbi:cyclin-dependent kinase inhibitor far1 [Mortierella alpina]|nr:cyclin-dependent kinase inhibitor far1 [Mortierella alpina]
MSSGDPLQALEFYTQNNIVFLTGGTGFMGKVILEKILRSLPMVQKIYLLVRASCKAAAYDRLEKKIFGCRIFETIKAQISDDGARLEKIKRKVVPILGDLVLDGLGISSEDLEMVRKDTRVFLHCAASVKFDDPLRVALELNTLGSLRTLEVAKQMQKLQAFVHVSTSYVNAHLRDMNVKEKIYPLPFGDPEAFFCRLSKMSDQELSVFERDFVLKMYPSTYKFTKSLTEHLMQSRRRSLSVPMVIVRVPVVGGALAEPVPGWCEGISGAVAVMVCCALGVVQEWYGDETKVLDMIPVDVAVKTVLMAGPALVSKSSELSIISDTIPVIQMGTSTHSPLNVGDLFCHWESYWQQQPQLSQRVSNDIRVDFYSIHDFPRRYQQRFRAEIESVKASKDGAKKYRKMLRKAEVVPKLYLPFTCYEWFFDAKNGLRLDDVAPAVLHSGIGAQIDWHTYLHTFNMGVHDYILGETVDRTMEIHYQWRVLHKNYEATEGEVSDLLMRSRL